VHSTLALSYLLKIYHADFTETQLTSLSTLIFSKLSDNASAVRESAALALVDLAPALSL